MEHTVVVTDETFAGVIKKQDGLVVVDFWAPWCPPCRALAPGLEELATEYAGRVTIAKLDIDESPQTATEFNVRSIPSLLFFRNGALIDRTVGALPKSIVAMKIEQHRTNVDHPGTARAS